MIFLILLFLSFMLIIIGIVMIKKTRDISKSWLITKGGIIYNDLINPVKLLYSPTLPLSGKPDYIIKTREKTLIPVEIKSGNHNYPKTWHKMQLIAYCQLISETYKLDVPYGILTYYDSKKQFHIPFDQQQKTILLNTINQMMHIMRTQNISRNHNDEKRCEFCSYNTICPETLRIKKINKYWK